MINYIPFSLGEKVEIIPGDSSISFPKESLGIKGIIRIIVKGPIPYGVELEKPITYGHSLGGLCSSGYGWFFSKDSLKSLEKKREDGFYVVTLKNYAIKVIARYTRGFWYLTGKQDIFVDSSFEAIGEKIEIEGD